MWEDPIVKEVRKAGEKLAAESGNDLHEFCEVLRHREQDHPEKLVKRGPRFILKSTGTSSD